MLSKKATLYNLNEGDVVIVNKQTMKLVKHIESISKAYGVSLIQYTNLYGQDVFLREENKEYFINNGFLWSISLAIGISRSASDLLKHHKDRGLLMYFSAHCLGQADLLEAAAQTIAYFIDSNNYKAIVIPGRGRAYNEGAPGIVSHRTLSRISGIGSIGDSGLIITKDFGPRVRLISIITNMPLPDSLKNNELDFCLHCGKCYEICPVKAISGKAFNSKQPCIPLIDNYLCSEYRSSRLAEYGTKFCNLCQYICPVGK